MFASVGNANLSDGLDGNAGNRTLTVVITITAGPAAKLFGRLEAKQSP